MCCMSQLWTRLNLFSSHDALLCRAGPSYAGMWSQSPRLGLDAVSRPFKASVLSQTDWQTARSLNWGSRSWYRSRTVRLLTHLCNNVAVICTSNSLTYIWDRSRVRRKLSCLERFLFPWCTSYIGCFILPVMGHLELRFTTVTRLAGQWVLKHRHLPVMACPVSCYTQPLYIKQRECTRLADKNYSSVHKNGE